MATPDKEVFFRVTLRSVMAKILKLDCINDIIISRLKDIIRGCCFD